MKRFSDLTDAEILALTEAEIAYHIDYECAEAGAGLLPPDPGPEPVKPEGMKDVSAFEVEGLVFTSREDALRVAEALEKCSRYELRYVGNDWSQQVLVRESGPVEVKPVKHYSPNGWDAAKTIVRKYADEKKAWDERVSEMQRIIKERDSATEWVRNRIGEVRENEWRRQRVLADFERYVELAGGDRVIARRFLVKANPSAEQFIAPIATEAEAPAA